MKVNEVQCCSGPHSHSFYGKNDILNIFLCVLKKESKSGLEEHEAEKMVTEFLGELSI